MQWMKQVVVMHALNGENGQLKSYMREDTKTVEKEAIKAITIKTKMMIKWKKLRLFIDASRALGGLLDLDFP